MTSAVLSNDYEWYLGPAGGSGGLDFGLNTNIDVMRVKGLTDLTTRRTDRSRSQLHGQMPGLHKANAKAIEFELHIRKGSLTDAQWRSLILDVEEAFTVYDDSEVELHYRLAGLSERFLRVRGLRRTYIIDPESEMGIAVMKCQLTAADPRVYNVTQQTDNGNTGTHSVTNNGRSDAYPIVTFTRTTHTQLKITNSTTGQVLDVNVFGAGYPDNNSLVCNMDKLVRGDSGLIIYNPSTSVSYYGYWVAPREPFYLAPGSNSITLNFGTDVSYAFYEPDPI